MKTVQVVLLEGDFVRVYVDEHDSELALLTVTAFSTELLGEGGVELIDLIRLRDGLEEVIDELLEMYHSRQGKPFNAGTVES